MSYKILFISENYGKGGAGIAALRQKELMENVLGDKYFIEVLDGNTKEYSTKL